MAVQQVKQERQDALDQQSRWRIWRLWGASASSNLADGLFQVGLSLLAVSLTRSAEAIAAVLLLARLPWLLLALHAGVIADRVDRLRLLARTNIGRMALIGTLAVLMLLSVKHLVLLYIVAFGLGVAETLFDTSIHSVVPMITPSKHLERANSYMQSAELLMLQFIGPPLGGLLAGIALWLVFGTSALVYLLSVLLLLWVGVRTSTSQARTVTQQRVSQDIREGLQFLWRHPLLRTFALITGMLNVANAAFLAVLPLYAIAPGPVQLGAAGYGLLLTGAGIGGLLAALVTPFLKTLLGTSRLLLISVLGLALGLGIPAVTANPFLIAGGLTVTGVGIFWNVITVSLRQRIVPEQILGRVNATYRMCAYGALPIGAALGGWIGSFWGLRAVFGMAFLLSGSMLLPLTLLISSQRIASYEGETAKSNQLANIEETR